MQVTNIRSRLVSALVGALLCLALLVAGAESGASHVAIAAIPVDTACESRADEAWLVLQRQQAREERTQRLREREEGRQEQELLQEYRAGAYKDMARRNVAARGIADLVPEEYQYLVLDVAEQFDIDPRLIGAVGMVESHWYPRALGTQQDTGIMQILPSTGRWIASRLGLETYDLFDPETNVTMGAWYLRILYDEYGSWEKALAAYNGGPRLAHRGADWPYTQKVLRVYNARGT
jgi:soluble lytic murein transglycosylase-like protein